MRAGRDVLGKEEEGSQREKEEGAGKGDEVAL